MARVAAGSTNGEQAAVLLPCTGDGSGVWSELGGSRHDNLVVTTDAEQVHPGETFVVTLQWEWQDWRPGAPLVLRACLDADGPDAVDGESSEPLEDLGVGPVDAAFVHAETEPGFRTRTESGKVRPVVTAPLTIAVPESAPAGGEICVRTAVTGAPGDHRESPPLFDISETLCRPVVVVAPSPSPSPMESPVPSPTPEAVATRPPDVLGEQLTRTQVGEIPASGFAPAPRTLLGALLIASGIGLGRAARRRSNGAAVGKASGAGRDAGQD
jgi:hypothetical protein